MQDRQTFDFKICMNVIVSTGKKARNIFELRAIVVEISDNSVYHHTYQYFLKRPTLEYTNDFARWVGEYLKENNLAEKLSNVDPYSFKSIELLRNEILRSLDLHVEEFPEHRNVFPGDEFYFNEAITLISPLGTQVKNLAEFLMALKYIPSESIYFHFYDARVRLGKDRDDFSLWFEENLQKNELSEKVKRIDIFMSGIEKSRSHIIELVEEEVKREMERFG